VYDQVKSSKPTVEDEEQLDKVLRYINETKDFDLIFNVFDLTVHAYIDASFAVHTDAKSHTGAIISLGPNGGTLYAKSSKQKLVTWSSTEAELVAVHDAMAHSLNVQNIVKELTGVYKPIQLHQDNLSTIHLINSQEAVGQRSRHINIRYFSIREYIEGGIIVVNHLATELMKADILTKPLSGELFNRMRDWILNR
jgi:hypothetical protein